MNNSHNVNIHAVTFLDSAHWPIFKGVLDEVIRETRLKKYILAISGDEHGPTIALFQKMYKEKIHIIQGEDLTHSELFAKTIAVVKECPCDYVLILDSESIPEKGWVDAYLNNLTFFKEKDRLKVIMIGNTVDIFDKEHSYYGADIRKNFRDGTLFDILNVHKIKVVLRQILHLKRSQQSSRHIFKTNSSIGGGTLIPFAAIKEAKEPDASLVMYGDDIDYAWKLKEAGYSFFQCLNPILRRPSSEKDTPSHVLSLFSSDIKDYEAYYRIRNSVRISREHTYQSKPALFLNVITWISLASAFGFWETTSFRLFFHRIKIVTLGLHDGYFTTRRVPTFADSI